MSDGSRRTLSLERLIILGAALALIAAGLWLAVGAGTSTGESARTAAYPSPTFHFQVTLSCKPPKKTTSHKAKLCFDTEGGPGVRIPAPVPAWGLPARHRPTRRLQLAQEVQEAEQGQAHVRGSRLLLQLRQPWDDLRRLRADHVRLEGEVSRGRAATRP